ncbi:Zona pellucida domain [Cinara cedri]|uniref:Zona pellucida domain n=1 Tax=Cinara cedri TaxID=506608 RepID=A0A5E4MB25_9HEMI|nr:Zona pellucida domain [Cinara cedri]
MIVKLDHTGCAMKIHLRHQVYIVFYGALLFLLHSTSGDTNPGPENNNAAALPLEHRSGGYDVGLPLSSGGPLQGPDESWPLQTVPDAVKIKHLQVQCEKTHMRVNIEFDRPFYGVIFSKGFYSDPHCVHVKPGTGHLSATFEILLNSCGMTSSGGAGGAVSGYGQTPSGSYVENTIIIQYDPYVQEVWDQARKLRCTWYDFYEKAVTFQPFQVDMLHAVTANFLGDNLQCWMQIQVGKGPWASEVSGIVKIGQTMTMVLAIKDEENKFDMLVRNCVAHDGKRTPIQLVDHNGCVIRPKIMYKFQKIKNFGPSASVVSFTYFQAFKFPDSMNVHFQCVIQVCRYHCPEPKCPGDYALAPPAAPTDISNDYSQNSVHSNEYGPPPVAADYPAYPDPRHPSGPAGAYSELKPEIVLPNSPSPSSSSSSSSPQPPQKSSLVQDDDDLHLPPPPLPGHGASYATVKRQGTVGGGSDEDQQQQQQHMNLVSLGGRPRSVDMDKLQQQQQRHRRSTANPELDVNTSRIIQVVAPGDVNFALNVPSAGNGTGNGGSGNGGESVVMSTRSGLSADSVCISVPSFVAGLAMLLSVLVVACLVVTFLFLRVRSMNKAKTACMPTAQGPYMHGAAFEAAEFVKMASS